VRSTLERAAAPGVRLLGASRDVRAELHAADVFVLPSWTEGMSNSLLEAMATGIEVVATQVGGTVELTQGGRLAHLVPPGDVASLAAAVSAALCAALPDDREPRVPYLADMAAARRQRVLRDFSLETTARRLGAVYGGLVDQRPAARGAGQAVRRTRCVSS
jgi:glycosyltransferase involved in cell wall biosynthesis